MRAGFTLLELLVVVSIISVLMAISVPALNRARRKAQVLLGINNQRQIVGAVNCFANEHGDLYPATTAKLGDAYWVWQEPTRLTGYHEKSPGGRRSVATYLDGYIDNADIAFCPSAPENKYFEDAWNAGDAWETPDSPPGPDPFSGTYCFYWNYVGYLEESGKVFRGPCGPAGGNGQGSVVVSDYFGYDHWRSRYSFGSCEPVGNGRVAHGTPESSAYWSMYDSEGGGNPADLSLDLHAGYIDGHVEKYNSSQVARMRVFVGADLRDVSPIFGVFFLPRNGLE